MTSKKFYVLTAPTGAGKTYLALQKALFEAQRGRLCIVAFHTLVLVEQAEEVAGDILQKYSKDLPDVKITVLTQTEAVPSPRLLEYFIQGKVVVLTLHTYLQTLGDLFMHPNVQLFSYFFCEKVTVVIDESHEFLNKCDRTIQLTYGTVDSYGSKFVIENSNKLMASKFFKTYEVSSPTLHLRKISGAEHLFEFSMPDQIFPGVRECLLFKNISFSSLIQDISFEQKMTAIVKNENPLEVIPWNTELFLDSFFPDIQLEDKIVYENPYIICQNLLISNKNKNFNEFQKYCFDSFFKILHYNAIHAVLNNLNHDKLIFQFSGPLNHAVKEKNWHQFDSLLFEQKKIFLTLFQAKYIELNIEETKTHFFEDLLLKIDKMWEDYVFILRKKDGKLQIHDIANADTAFFIKFMCSSIHEFVTVFPSFQGNKIKNIKNFIETIQNERISYQNTNHKMFEEVEDDSFEIIVDDEIDVLSSNDETEKKVVLKKQKKSLISQSSAPPFTTYLNLFDKWSLLLLLKNNITLFISATPNERHYNNLQKAFPDQVEFIDYVKHSDPLDKLYVVLSNVDYFANARPTWKNLWQEFGDYYFQQITKPSKVKKNEYDYALLLLPSEKKAKFFFERGIPNKSPFFSKVANKYEFFESGYFKEGGLLSSRFSVRVASIQSSISCGLNLPNHPFLFVSFNVFKPMFTLYKRGNSTSVVSAQTLDAYSILKQGIGRIARKSQYEKENKEERSTRILFVSKYTKFPGIMNIFYKDFSKIYDDFEILDISDYESEISSIFKRNKGLSVFKEFQTNIPHFRNTYFSDEITSTESFRIIFLKKLVDLLKISKSKNVSFNFEEIVAHYFQFFLIVTVCDISNTLYQQFLEGKEKIEKELETNPNKRIRKKNIYSLPSANSLIRRYRPQEKPRKITILFEILKNDLIDFLENEKENEYMSFQFDEKLSGLEKSFCLFETIMNLPNVSSFFKSFSTVNTFSES